MASNSLCRNFSATGYCKFGDKCRFVHRAPPGKRFMNSEPSIAALTPTDGSSIVPLNNRGAATVKKQCKFFKAGHCRKGGKCLWSHDLENVPAVSVNHIKEVEAMMEAMKRQQEEEECLRLEEERRAREAEAEAARRARQARLEAEREAEKARLTEERKVKQAEIAEREASVTIRRVVVEGSTLVTCAAGFNVQHLICGFDSCYLTIKGLPRDVKRPEIEELFFQQGVDSRLFCIVKQRQLNGETEAKIMIDAEIGQAVAAGLDGVEFRDDSFLDIALDEGGVPNKMGSASERNANVLAVSWRLPSSTMVAEYGATHAALDAVARFNNSIFNGRKIRAELNRGRNSLIPKEFSTSVKISGLPPNTTELEVETHTGALLVRILHRPAKFDTKDIERDLRRRIEFTGGAETFEISPANPNKANVEVRIRFRTWDSAKRVHDLLKTDKRRSDYPIFYISLPKPIQYVITIPLAQYRAQKGRWDSMTEGDNKAAFIKIGDNGTDRAFIRVLGEDKKAVGQLKVRVENLVAGETLDVKLWHRTFMSAQGRRFLDGIGSQTKTYVRGDWKTKTLRLYANDNAKEVAMGLIRAEIDRLEASEVSVPINRCVIGYFMRKGLTTLKEELGEDGATLELVPIPRLVIRGGEEARLIVNRLIDESRAGIESEAKDSEDTCPICFDDVTSPVLLGCGHFYCTACIRHFLSSASERKAFPLVCAGDEDRCKAPIAIPIVRRFLLPQQFDQLVEAAATTYIEKQPNKFRYCTTPDCPQVYRCERGTIKTLTCPSCFVTVCTGCHKEAHEGMTCREREIMHNPEEQERLNEEWARAAGAKRCPSCRVWMQKTEGCNHMTCKCGAHICWICLASFTAGDRVYTHLREVHGGIFDNEIRQAQAAHVDEDLRLAQRLQREEEARVGIQPAVRIGYQGPVHQVAAAAQRLRQEQEQREAIRLWEQDRNVAEARAAEARAAVYRERLQRDEREARAFERRVVEEQRTQNRRSWCIIM